ncbi:winged helix-turn-helix domain-containing protein [Pseudomonas hormoni]|uniref:Winged helix-turn-helix domain-containing protein n=1 Tax=Pseudomonas hormoni TaxID=3093767 RepID=A0ABX8F6A6_9PSED|nr:winged helix-turn-helix domain-containing protein [Pseudomonas hormoni]QVW26108.1 winged helix-turn-helix domain-containing protein [Pseudomonas hormoni]
MNGSASDSSDTQCPQSITFGQFHLLPAQRLLLKNGKPIELGSRALDVLIALLEHAGEVVSNRDLIRMVWQDVIVDESCLRVHISALRKALACAETDVSYIANVPGRGYSFVASVTRDCDSDTAQVSPTTSIGALPPRLLRMVGRDETVPAIAQLIKLHRFVTICGHGGMGKTTLALAVTHHLATHFGSLVLFQDMSSIADPALLPGILASALGIQYRGMDPLQELMAFSQEQRLLLVLDSCDHIIVAATYLAEKLYGETEHVHILVTSREPLRAEGEHVHRLCPLTCPPEMCGLTATDALTFSAVRLLVERVHNNDNAFILSDNDAPMVAHICRKLDGMPLAIELAAGQVEAYGIQGIAELLNNRVSLFWDGRRTALPRHQSLMAMFDWSCDLLSETEAMVLRRLSVLSGVFSLEMVTAIVKSEVDESLVIDAIGRLVTKSLILVERAGRSMRYKLPHTMRAYALEKLRTSGEVDLTIERHAIYLLSMLERLNVPGETLPEYERIQLYIEHLGNICSALEWAFSNHRNLLLGIRLAAASAPLFLGLSMLDECRRWSERALAARAEVTNGAPPLVVQHWPRSIPPMMTSGTQHTLPINHHKGIESVANPDDNLLRQSQNFDLPGSEGKRSPHDIQWQNLNLSTRITEPKIIAMMQWTLENSGRPAGVPGFSFRICKANSDLKPPLVNEDEFSFGYDYRIRALASLARVLWLRGYPDQAARIGRQALGDAYNLRHPATICLSLIYVATVFLWVGDWNNAEQTIDKLISTAEEHAFGHDHAAGIGLKGILLIGQDRVDAGIHLLHDCLNVLSIENHQVLTTMFVRCLAKGVAAKGRYDNAIEIASGALEMVENVGETFDTPEILRVTADLYAYRPSPDLALAEQYLNRSLACAERLSALAWELRTAISLTRLHLLQGRDAEAGQRLQSVYNRFSEGFDSADLRAAKQLLNSLNKQSALKLTPRGHPATRPDSTP